MKYLIHWAYISMQSFLNYVKLSLYVYAHGNHLFQSVESCKLIWHNHITENTAKDKGLASGRIQFDNSILGCPLILYGEAESEVTNAYTQCMNLDIDLNQNLLWFCCLVKYLDQSELLRGLEKETFCSETVLNVASRSVSDFVHFVELSKRFSHPFA